MYFGNLRKCSRVTDHTDLYLYSHDGNKSRTGCFSSVFRCVKKLRMENDVGEPRNDLQYKCKYFQLSALLW